jgi:hypothetical protein
LWFYSSTALAQFNPIQLSGGPVVKMVADFQRPYIYAIASPASGATNGTLLFINVTNGALVKTLPIGDNPTDLTVNAAEGRLYVANYSSYTTPNPPIYVADLTTQTLLSPLNPWALYGQDVLKVNAIQSGRIIIEGGLTYILDSTSGALLYNMFEFSGDGEVDATGAYYYHCDGNNSSANVYKYQIVNDTLVGATNSPLPAHPLNPYGTYNLVLSHDGSTLFWNGYAYDANLSVLGRLGAEIYACSTNGTIAIGSSQAFDAVTFLPMFNLPVGASVLSLDRSEQRLWYYNAATNDIESISLSSLESPTIVYQPTNQTVYSGNNAVVNVGAAGLEPLTYLWFYGGTNFAQTTSGTVIIPNFQAASAGNYAVVITNRLGSVASSNCLLSIQYNAPIIISQPAGAQLLVSSNVTFTVGVAGSWPLSYQWQFNGINIAGATNSVFSITNLLASNRGNYDVVVTNAFGSTNSASAYLDVVDTAEALNATNFTWISGGDAPWFVQTDVTYDGVAAMQSGPVLAGQQSILQTTVTGPGTLTFWWNVSSGGSNYLNFSVNGIEQTRISGIVIYGFYGWNQQTVYLGDGSQTLQWDYVKQDSSLSNSGRDSGWLDEVNLSAGGTTPFVTLNPSNQVVLLGSTVTLTAMALGTPPLNYQWELNGTNVDGATNTVLSLPNAQFANEGNYSLVISNEFGFTNTVPVFVNVVDFTESLNATNLTWTTGGDVPWFPETATTHDGIAALQSGAIGASQQSTLSTTVSGPGTLSFWWKVSSETNNDFANYTVDAVEQSRISGTVNWQQQTYYLTPGSHALAWNYSKNATINGGSDAAWLDQVLYTNGATAAFIAISPTNLTVKSYASATFIVSALGTPPLYYQWLFNGTNINSATSANLTLSPAAWTNEGVYSVIVSNAYGSVISSNATLTLIRNQVVAWGNNSYGQTNVPVMLTNTIGIAAGYENSMAVKADGTVAGWGYNGLQETTPPTGLSNVTAIATSRAGSGAFSLALKTDGTVFGWGNNAYKQTNAPSGLSNVVAIAAGQYHGLALRNDGKVFAWGNNSYGQTNVPAILTNATAIAAGFNYCLALRNDGSLVAWGDNTYGQTNIPSALTNVTAIASGWYHCLALKNDGTITAWGNNSYQQTNVPAGLSNVIAISVGQYHSLAVKNDGTVVAWGQNTFKQTNVPAGLNHVVAVAGGVDHSMALIQDGPPVIFTQPVSQTNYAGFTVLLGENSSGLQPLYFQWILNGTNLIGATNSTLMFTHLQPGNAGIYSFIVSNALGNAVSSNAFIGVLTNSPILTLQPTNQTAIAGSNVTFSVAVGAGPIPNIYQWQFNGTNIIGATNAVLTLTNVQTTNQGNFAAVVNNGYGTVSSSNAYLTVIVLDFPTALNTPGWTWTNSGSAAWFAETNTSYDGVEAAQSGLINNGQSSALQTIVTGPGTLTYWWMFSPLTSPFPNTLSFSSSQANASTSVNSTAGWQQKTIYLGVGQQTLSWIYSRNSIFSAQSTGWVDQVSFIPGSTSPAITSISSNTYMRANSSVVFSVGAYGTPPLAYQWQLNGTNLLNKTNTFLNFSGVQPTNAGIYTVIITNGFGSIATNATLWVGQFALNTGPTNLFMSTNGFQLNLGGVLTTNPVVVFGSTDLVNWLPLFTNSATTGSVQFLDVTATNLPARFYRAQE